MYPTVFFYEFFTRLQIRPTQDVNRRLFQKSLTICEINQIIFFQAHLIILLPIKSLVMFDHQQNSIK
jgi:hypothetical protein